MSASPSLRRTTYDLSERVALVTGAYGGLGPSVCLTLLASGATVIAVTSHARPDELERLRVASGANGARLREGVADARDERAVAALVGEVASREGRVDILVNIIGGFAAGQPVTELDEETLTHMLDLNLKTAFRFSKYAAREMARNDFGRIINLSSRAAVSGRKKAAAYAISKAAVITLTEAQAEETRDQGITVNAILPSVIDTPANRAAMPNAQFDRWPRPEEVARVIAFLASDDAGLISGASIPVYGRA